jgi:hypothetical protein
VTSDERGGAMPIYGKWVCLWPYMGTPQRRGFLGWLKNLTPYYSRDYGVHAMGSEDLHTRRLKWKNNISIICRIKFADKSGPKGYAFVVFFLKSRNWNAIVLSMNQQCDMIIQFVTNKWQKVILGSCLEII